MIANEVASFKCDLIVQKIRKEADETIMELHERIRKENDGENMLQKYRILEENKKEKNIKDDENDQSESKEETDEHSNQNNSDEEKNENKDEIEDNENDVVIKDLKEPKQVNKLKDDQIKAKYIQNAEGHQYLNYFKCLATGSYYRKEVSFKVDCKVQRDIEIYIYKGEKIAKKIAYKFENFFSSVDLTEKETHFPEFSFNFDNEEDFIIFKPDDENCVLRISKAFNFSLFVVFLIFIINL